MIATILIIDGNEDDLVLCRRAFRDSSHELISVSSAHAGLAYLADARHVLSPLQLPALILLDYNLPDMDGLVFMKMLAEYLEMHIPVVMLTAGGNEAVAVEAMKNGAADYLVKDSDGRYLKLLPGVAGCVMSAHAQHVQLPWQETESLLLRNQTLMQNSMDGIHVMDLRGNLMEANDAFCRMLGYTRAEMTGFHVADWAAKFADEKSLVVFDDHTGKSVLMETLHRRKDGALINVEISVTREDIDGQGLLFCSSRDITGRKKTEKEILLESDAVRKRAEELAQRFGHLLHGSFNEIYLFDANSWRYLQVSDGARKNLGYSAGELEQLTQLDLNPSHTRESFESLIAPLRSGERQSLLFETFHRRKNGTTYPVEIRLQLIEADLPVFMAIIQDTTERRRAQMPEFTAHLQTIHEEEKAGIAREIHDDLGGTLAALRMDAYWLADKLSANKVATPLLKRVESMSCLLDNALKDLRCIITGLRPAMLDDLGLLAALEWHADQFHKRTGTECYVVCSAKTGCECKLGKALSINMFRIFQESLTNVSQHSGATRVEIECRRADDEVLLSISDNGCGLPEGHTIAPTSYGIRGMRERVGQLGGKIKFDRPVSGGFSVQVVLPVDNKISEKHDPHPDRR